MLNRRQVVAEAKNLNTFKDLVQAYSEVAALRVQRLRQAVLQNRSFMGGLQEIYESLKFTYRREILRLRKGKNLPEGKLSLLRRNGKTAYVLVSASTGLYGDLIKKTYELFKSTLNGEEGDVVMVGRLGAALFREEHPKGDFTYFDFPDDRVAAEAMSTIARWLLNYERVIVFYGRFETITSQVPYFSGISGEGLKPSRKPVVAARYLFEPSLETILLFFESQIFTSLFAQAVYENFLAKFAARMFSLDTATERVKKRLGEIALQRLRFRHREVNEKQLSSLAGISLWGVR